MTNNEIYKKEIIGYVDEIATELRKVNIKRSFKDEIAGKSQMRSLAELCVTAQCFDEIRLLVEYKISKGNGWDIELGSESYGKHVLNKMDKINTTLTERKLSEKSILNNLSLFFGYLHWKINAEVAFASKKF